MRNLQRVVWSKGMFLGPQHFQTQDQYFEDTLQTRFAASHFANWGFWNLSIDAESLATGRVVLQVCSGVMPDGLVFEMPGSDDLPAGRNIQDYFPVDVSSLD